MPETLAKTVHHDEEIKRSRFIVHAARADAPEQALAFIARRSMADATHNCWAYRVGEAYRFNDDGEPAGTAGRPILGAIDQHGLDRVVVLVVRYFGGVKLGAGGLARAYGGSAARCLHDAERAALVEFVRCAITVEYADTGRLYEVLGRFSLGTHDETHGTRGVSLSVDVEASDAEALHRALRDATQGRARIERLAGGGLR